MHKNFPFVKFEKYDETSSVTSFKSISLFSDVKGQLGIGWLLS